ncbi:unnamed protein product, partial [marine sediment metagenome]
MKSDSKTTEYDKIISFLFKKKYVTNENERELDFTKDEIVETAQQLNIVLRNPPDVVYTYRCRRALPADILSTGGWILVPKGKGRFSFCRTERSSFIEVQEGLAQIEILNAVPEIVEKYTSNDEQGLLSVIRYNRLIDIFTNIACFHLQSHIRTTIADEGQIEIDDLYAGIDDDGNEYILPVEAKSPDERDKLGWFQVANLVRYANQCFPKLKCRPIAAKPFERNLVCLM